MLKAVSTRLLLHHLVRFASSLGVLLAWNERVVSAWTCIACQEGLVLLTMAGQRLQRVTLRSLILAHVPLARIEGLLLELSQVHWNGILPVCEVVLTVFTTLGIRLDDSQIRCLRLLALEEHSILIDD